VAGGGDALSGGPPPVYRYTLIVGPEDERAATEGVLLRAGLPVAAATEEEIFAEPEILRPEILVLDDGADRVPRAATVRRLTALPAFRGVPYVILSWDSEIDSFSEAITHGASAYLVKPVGADDLVAVVSRIITWVDTTLRTERRRRLRRPLLLKIMIEVKARRLALPGDLVDVSSGGCRVETPEPLTAGESVRVVLHSPKDATHVALGAEVRWSRSRADARHEAGLRFTGTTALLAGKLLGFASPGTT
jgi:CheY-like chemotaxis protein